MSGRTGADGKLEIAYHAQKAVARTYTIEVTGADKNTGKTITRNINVTVKALPSSVDYTKATYQIELSNATIDENPIDENGNEKTWDDSTVAKLYATYNGLFAGYVRVDGDAVTVANKTVDDFVDARVTAKFGTATYTAGNLYGTTSGSAIVASDGKAEFNAVASSDVKWYSDNTFNTTVSYKKFPNGILATYKNKNKTNISLTATMNFLDSDNQSLSKDKQQNLCLKGKSTATFFFVAPKDEYGHAVNYTNYKGRFSVAKTKYKPYNSHININTKLDGWRDDLLQ